MKKTKEIRDLRPAAYNPRKISDKQLMALTESLREFGDLSGIVFNVRTGNIVGGHQRIKTLEPSWKIFPDAYPMGKKDKLGTVKIGLIETPFGMLFYREVDWDEKREMAANIAANKHGGDWDIPKLKEILTSLNDGQFNMGLTGFDEKELKGLIDYVPPGPAQGDGSGGDESQDDPANFRARMTPQQLERVKAAVRIALGDLSSHLKAETANGFALDKIAEFYLNHQEGRA